MTTARRKFLQLGVTFLGAFAISRLLRESEVPAQPIAYPPLSVSRRVAQIPLESEAKEWELATPIRIALGPQIIVKPRLLEPSVRELTVRSLYDRERVGFLLEWQEKSKSKNTAIDRTDNFRDAAALSFPANGDKPLPYFGMGHVNNEVVVYHWKSDWEFGPEDDISKQFSGMQVDFYPMAGKKAGEIPVASDYSKEGKEWPANKTFVTAWAAGSPLANPELKRKTSVEKLVASGFGNLTSDTNQDGRGKAKWDDGWHVVITFPIKQDRYTFIPGRTYPVNFAVWDGHNKERGAEKSISTWSSFALQRRVGFSSIGLGILAAGAVAVIEWLILRRQKARSKIGREKE